MTEDTIEIQTGAGFARLWIYPTSIKTDGRTTTAEVIEDWTPAHMELRKVAGVEALFRIQGREARYGVFLSEPFLELRKVMFRKLKLTELP